MRFQERFTGFWMRNKQASAPGQRHMCSKHTEKKGKRHWFPLFFFYISYNAWPRAKSYGKPKSFLSSGLHIFTLSSCMQKSMLHFFHTLSSFRNKCLFFLINLFRQCTRSSACFFYIFLLYAFISFCASSDSFIFFGVWGSGPATINKIQVAFFTSRTKVMPAVDKGRQGTEGSG